MAFINREHLINVFVVVTTKLENGFAVPNIENKIYFPLNSQQQHLYLMPNEEEIPDD